MSATIKATDPIVLSALRQLIDQKVEFGVLFDNGDWTCTLHHTLFITANGKLCYTDTDTKTEHSVSSWIKSAKNMKTVQWLQHLYFVHPTEETWIKFHTFIGSLIAIQARATRLQSSSSSVAT